MSYDVTVNLNGTSFGVRFKPSWSIARLKAEIARKRNVSAVGLKIIFAGQELPDTMTLGNCQMNHSVIHAVISLDATYDGNKTATQAANLTNVTLTQDDAEDGGSPQSGTQYYGTLLTSLTRLRVVNDIALSEANSRLGRQSYFYVYCKTCKRLTQGKLRCRCSSCKEGSFVLTQGPNCWEDVLTKARMPGRCESSGNCQCTTAEFYFKCGEHRDSDEQAPLSMLKSNIRNIPCITCSSETA
ncbi:E3 ubiquitin- ligase parkin isoform X1 [Paramuricea clavata]|uniref:E3 ubiquitin- ligase parkin isoform X1 n=1 Tax=Paramuricea clavata TaxID=317549 RepID=A0A6S7JLU9_PARCT|nr:E3 ubiquitin- ligase parkin isoform X1 [Paramuricea clavata]